MTVKLGFHDESEKKKNKQQIVEVGIVKKKIKKNHKAAKRSLWQ